MSVILNCHHYSRRYATPLFKRITSKLHVTLKFTTYLNLKQPRTRHPVLMDCKMFTVSLLMPERKKNVCGCVCVYACVHMKPLPYVAVQGYGFHSKGAWCGRVAERERERERDTSQISCQNWGTRRNCLQPLTDLLFYRRTETSENLSLSISLFFPLKLFLTRFSPLHFLLSLF